MVLQAGLDVKSYAEDVIPVIRKNAKDAIIIVGTPTWSQDVDLVAKDPITGQENICYTCHFYAATHKDNIRDKVKAAHEAGLCVFISSSLFVMHPVMVPLIMILQMRG